MLEICCTFEFHNIRIYILFHNFGRSLSHSRIIIFILCFWKIFHCTNLLMVGLTIHLLLLLFIYFFFSKSTYIIIYELQYIFKFGIINLGNLFKPYPSCMWCQSIGHEFSIWVVARILPYFTAIFLTKLLFRKFSQLIGKPASPNSCHIFTF